jgi:tripartite-type tricarboxylate transporter receptor subunit TctC
MLKALAVTSTRRIAAAPEVPTFIEAGVPGYESIGWFGAVAPAHTSGEIIGRLNGEMMAALAVPDVRERVLAAGAEPSTSTPQEFAAFIRDETRKWAQVIHTANVRIE